MKRLFLVLSVLIVTLFGCSNQSVSSSSKSSSNNKKEVSSEEKETKKQHNLSSEDKKIINLIKNKEFDHVIKETGELQNEFKKDYYFIASAYKKLEQLKGAKVSLDNYDDYTYVDAMLDKVKYKNSHADLDFLQTQENNKKHIDALQNDKDDQIQENIKEIEEAEKYSAIRERATVIEERTNSHQSVSVGMSKEEVLIEGWGKPEKINKTQTADHTMEQWIYKGNKYLYFENGILSTISN
ncbi:MULTISPECIES: hypothetical protein [unclassified Bacillus (in: firmicutes)]|uniref:hypothetical protein n=1 Tax=unclassified Bacillus (in: firmicutes) TaxID=185979 RepID=UPI000D0304AA|nr:MULTISPECIES: hypothetical protein [unclassified Bacillus (in: firmicutes)]PRS80656.1 hypothetical protein C6346_13180 [Bacillus sp. CJCL2]PRS82175.1 hypothetical protein C6348_17230 [Bacillus sp. YBWC18]PRS82224.1 hypothetical protein C6348_17480 [Bacillus sp. YBWC18]